VRERATSEGEGCPPAPPRRMAVLGARQAPNSCLIEAPCLVHGKHGDSLTLWCCGAHTPLRGRVDDAADRDVAQAEPRRGRSLRLRLRRRVLAAIARAYRRRRRIRIRMRGRASAPAPREHRWRCGRHATAATAHGRWWRAALRRTRLGLPWLLSRLQRPQRVELDRRGALCLHLRRGRAARTHAIAREIETTKWD
jgi:hypothetical protein